MVCWKNSYTLNKETNKQTEQKYSDISEAFWKSISLTLHPPQIACPKYFNDVWVI